MKLIAISSLLGLLFLGSSIEIQPDSQANVIEVVAQTETQPIETHEA